jgi:hypothetical protein
MSELNAAQASLLASGIIADVSSDPRTGGGQVGLMGAFAFDGSNFYQKVSTGNNDWRLIACQKQDLVANATTLTFSGLLGNRDGGYLLDYLILNASGGGPQLDIRPNNLATNQFMRRIYNAGSTDTLAFLDLGTGISAGEYTRGQLLLTSRAGQRRFASGRFQFGTGTAAPAATVVTEGLWNETATEITSLVIVSSLANGLGAGSKFALYTLGNPVL